jgi:hypothetical protein
MSGRINKNNICFLQKLVAASPKSRKEFIANADKEKILCICEIFMNLLDGNIPLDTEVKSKLKKHKHVIRFVKSRKPSIDLKRKVLIQKGGALISALVPAMGFLMSLLQGDT